MNCDVRVAVHVVGILNSLFARAVGHELGYTHRKSEQVSNTSTFAPDKIKDSSMRIRSSSGPKI